MWKENICSKKYDYEYILILKDELKTARENEDYQSLIHIIRSNAVRDLVLHYKKKKKIKNLIEIK